MDKKIIDVSDNVRAVAIGNLKGLNEKDIQKCVKFIQDTVDTIEKEFPKDLIPTVLGSMPIMAASRALLEQEDLDKTFSILSQMKIQTEVFMKDNIMAIMMTMLTSSDKHNNSKATESFMNFMKNPKKSSKMNEIMDIIKEEHDKFREEMKW